MAAEHEHLAGEELLALLFEWRSQADAEAARAAGRSLQELRACPHCSSELEELERAIGGVRALLLQDEASLASHAFQQRVLAATTREDLGLIGDARLVLRFCATRLRASRLLRLAAASLLAHVIALPVLAYFVLRTEKEPGLRITIEIPPAASELPFADAPREPERDPVALEPSTPEPNVSGEANDAWERSIRSAERLLAQAELPSELATATGQSALERLLAARGARIRREASGRAGMRAPAGDSGPIEWCLWTELLLDDRVLSGRADPALADALDALTGFEADPLVVLALARAGAYGELEPSQRDALARLRAELAGSGRADPLALDGEPVRPLDRRWFEGLRDASGPEPGTTLRRWIEWGLGR
jgi:hypothetical protein